MILRRFTQHIKEQNWFAVGLDVIVVVVGIFLGMQVTEWNEERKTDERSDAMTSRILEDLNYDMAVLQHRKFFWSKVLNDSLNSEKWLSSDKTMKPYTWEVLVSLIHATQTAQLQRNSITFEELQSSGELDLIRDIELRKRLSRYYSEQERISRAPTAYAYVPEFRTTLRSMIPGPVLIHYWNSCYGYSEKSDQVLIGCEAPTFQYPLKKILQNIENNEDVLNQLRTWIDVISVSTLILTPDGQFLESLIHQTQTSLSGSVEFRTES